MKYPQDFLNQVINMDCIDGMKLLPDECIDSVITSPPYWNLRDYSTKGQYGMETTFQEYLMQMFRVFDEVKRILKSTGTCFVNLGDTYGTGSAAGDRSNSKQGTIRGSTKWYQNTGKPSVKGFEKSLLQIPARFSIGMYDRGWKLRNCIIWHKKNAMPSSVLDRLTNKYEQIFFFVKSNKYFFDLDSIRVPFQTNEERFDGNTRARERGYNTKIGTKRRIVEEQARQFGFRRNCQNENEYKRNPLGKNPGDIIETTSQPFPEAHVAVYPEKLIVPFINAGCPEGGIICDPFLGSGTTARVAKDLKRNFIGFEINCDYVKMARRRLQQEILF